MDVSWIIGLIGIGLNLCLLLVIVLIYQRRTKLTRESYEMSTNYSNTLLKMGYGSFVLGVLLDVVSIIVFFTVGNGVAFALLLMFSLVFYLWGYGMILSIYFEYLGLKLDHIVVHQFGKRKKEVPISDIVFYGTKLDSFIAFTRTGKRIFAISITSPNLKDFIKKIEERRKQYMFDYTVESDIPMPKNVKKMNGTRAETILNNAESNEQDGTNTIESTDWRMIGKEIKEHLFSYIVLPGLLKWLGAFVIVLTVTLFNFFINMRTSILLYLVSFLAIFLIGCISFISQYFKVKNMDEGHAGRIYGIRHPKVIGHRARVMKIIRTFLICGVIIIGIYGVSNSSSGVLIEQVQKDTLVEVKGKVSYIERYAYHPYIGLEGNTANEYTTPYDFSYYFDESIYDEVKAGDEITMLIEDTAYKASYIYSDSAAYSYDIYAVEVNGKSYLSYENYARYVAYQNICGKIIFGITSVVVVGGIVAICVLGNESKKKVEQETVGSQA